MNTIRDIADLRKTLDDHRSAGRTIGLVPTMGALHDGHLSLIDIARQRCDLVVLSIFVNPLQFGPREDLERYPRPEAADLDKAAAAEVDIAFLPSTDAMYPQGASTTVRVTGLSEVLEGAHRPGHFDGVATVVAKLFNLVEPDVAVFGQKDAQQVAVIRKMVEDLDFSVELVVGPTIREDDGLAMSSRNAYLTGAERGGALALSRALEAGAEALKAGESPARAEQTMLDVLTTGGLEIDYAAVVDPDTFGEPGDGDVLLVLAARVGATRLIDNTMVKASERGTV